jgi:hypothetical protein
MSTITRPVPKPCPPPRRPAAPAAPAALELAIRKAIRRDSYLNPEEAAVYRTADQAGRPPLVPRSPRERLAPYVPLLERAGWTLHVAAADHRGRIEAFHPDGAIAMVKARPDRPYGARLYVLHAPGAGPQLWLAVNRTSFEYFAQRCRLPDGPVRAVGTKCRCRKLRYPSQQAAMNELVNVKLKRAFARRISRREQRAYRCPVDDRVWHLTSRARTDSVPATKVET